MTPYKPEVVLKEINFSILSDRDRIDIIDHIISELAKIEGSDPYLDKLKGLLIEIRERLDAAMNRSASHVLTKEIGHLNKERKELITVIEKGIAFFGTHKDPAVLDAVEIINASCRKLTALPDSKKRTLTAAIKKFLADMATPPAVSAAEKILLTDPIADLTTAQTRLDQLTEERARDEEHNTPPTLTAAREDMRNVVTVVEKVLWTNVLLEEPGMADLVLNMNGRIGEIMTTAKALHTLGEHAHLKTEPEEPGAVEESSGENSSEEKSEE